MINQNMGKVIDEIRQERKLSRDDLCENIMSVRNYQRFVSEEVNVSNDKLSKLVDRLNLDYFTLREIYTHRSQDKYSKLHNVYTLMQGNSDQKAYEELGKINSKSIDSAFMLSFYNYLKLDLERQLGITDTNESLIKLSALIDYPNVLNYEVLNFIELNVLAILNKHQSSKEDDTIANFLYSFLIDEELGKKGLIASFLPALYASTAQSFGSFKNYEKALEISDKGIKECIKLQMFNGLYHLFYFKALSHKALGQKKKANETLKRLHTLLHTLQEEDKIKEFLPIFEKNFKKEIKIIFQETELS